MDWLRHYNRWFSINEIASSVALKWVFGSLCLSHLVTFLNWFSLSTLTVSMYQAGNHTCQPYFQDCGRWFFLQTPPDGYSQSVLYAVLFAFILFAVHAAAKQRWTLAHALFMPAFLWHSIVILLLSEELSLNFQYYVLIFSVIFLFLPHKEYFLKFSLVLLYFLSTTVKIHESWVLGTYFSSLKLGLPLFPKWSIPFWTNLVILMEMVAAWWLLSRPGWKQQTVFVFFVCFHLYSIMLVGYRYPLFVLPILYILFGVFYRYQNAPFDRKSLAGWVLMILLCCLQTISHLIPGDAKLTLEGNKYGQYMFEANHQCVTEATIHYYGGATRDIRVESGRAFVRCNPYNIWFRFDQYCQGDAAIERIAWTLDHSINGGPFYRIVDVENACALSYKPFSRNEWIKTEKDQLQIMGRPVENWY